MSDAISSGLVLCPLAFEAKSLHDTLTQLGAKPNLITVFNQQLWHFPELGFVLGAAGLGKKNYFIEGQKILKSLSNDNYNFNYLVCAGGAGALTENLHVGDVVIDCPPSLIEAFAHMGPGFIVGKGSIATADTEIQNAEQAEALFQKTAAVAVGLEGDAARKLAEGAGLFCIEARGITDNVLTKKIISLKSEFKKNLPLAMKNLSEVLCELKELIKP